MKIGNTEVPTWAVLGAGAVGIIAVVLTRQGSSSQQQPVTGIDAALIAQDIDALRSELLGYIENTLSLNPPGTPPGLPPQAPPVPPGTPPGLPPWAPPAPPPNTSRYNIEGIETFPKTPPGPGINPPPPATEGIPPAVTMAPDLSVNNPPMVILPVNPDIETGLAPAGGSFYTTRKPQVETYHFEG